MSAIKQPAWMRTLWEARDHRGKVMLTNGHYAVMTETDAAEGMRDVGASTCHWTPDIDVSRYVPSVLALGMVCDFCKDEGVAGECVECHGSGHSSCQCRSCGNRHDAECGECDGTGRGACPACMGAAVLQPHLLRRFGEASFDLRYVKLVRDAIGGVTSIMLTKALTDNDHRALILCNDSKCGVIMCTRDRAEREMGA